MEQERKRAWIETDMAFLKIEGQAWDADDDGETRIRYGSEEMRELMAFDGSETTSRLTLVDREGASVDAVALPRIRWNYSRTKSREG